MANLGSRIGRRLKRIREYIKRITNKAAGVGWTTVPLVQPGDILMFKYRDEVDHDRLALVVTNDTGSTTYTSLRGNRLLSVFLLSPESMEINSMIIKKLYKDKRSCVRAQIEAGMESILGMDSYRTFIINEMREIYSLKISGDALDRELIEEEWQL